MPRGVWKSRDTGSDSLMVQLEQAVPHQVGHSGGSSRGHRSLPGVFSMVLAVGVPVWWILGMFQAVFFMAAVLMAVHLMRRRTIGVPSGFGVWLLFLVWLIGGLLVIQVDVPGAVPGGSSGRYLTFGYRFGWYTICTVGALYVLNTKSTLSSDRICAAVAWFFVVLTCGGLLGVLQPQLSFPSALELALPHRLTQQKFIGELIHPNVAQIHDFLGSASARPSAPFAYTNDWGLAIAITLPFFVLVWWRRGGAWRWAMLAILVISAVPIVSSLNRGLWMSILVVIAFTAVRSAVFAQIRLLGGIIALVVVAGVIVLASPLGSMIQARLDTPHSDQGRANLSTQTVASALEGSPVIGFGSTRDAAGNFASIAGGATYECPKCTPPPLGTHGQAWLLVFASGIGGLLLFTIFLVGQFLRHLRSRSTIAPAALACLLVLIITMPIYNSVGVPLFIGFVSIGLLAREADQTSAHPLTLDRLIGPIRRGAGIVLIFTLLGGLTGLLLHRATGQPARATQAVLVPAIDLVGVSDARVLTLDSEALLARSGAVLEAIGRATRTDDLEDVSRRLSIGAEPNTRVLTISYVDRVSTTASRAVEAAVRAYLAERTVLRSQARESVTTRLSGQHQVLDETLRTVEEVSVTFGATESIRAKTTMSDLRLQMSGVLSDMHAFGAGEVGHPLTEVVVHRSADALLVRIGSGLTLGAGAGLVFVWRTGDRRRRIRMVRRGEEILGLPVLLEVSPIGDGGGPSRHAADALRRYRPLCGVLADPDSPAASALAQGLSAALNDPFDSSGNRALFVVSKHTRNEALVQLRSRCHRMGIHPVGLVVATGEERSKGAAGR